jgi:endo-1,4-beta-D-glucanase Y
MAFGAPFLGLHDERAAGSSVPQHAFGAHAFTYTAGTIHPSNVTASQLDKATKTFYESWKKRYLVAGCGSGRYYVFVNADGRNKETTRGSISISEGHGYGMIITALMAGYDPDAQTYFDGLYHFFKDHPSRISPYLMAWNQVHGCRDLADDDGPDSATDGDLDIAYALVLADRQWGSAGMINYLQEAKNVIAAIRQLELNPVTSVMLLGGFAGPSSGDYYYGARSSDFMPDHFRSFQAATGDASWTKVVEAGYRLIRTLQRRFSSQTGLLPDFIQSTNTDPQPARPYYLETGHDGHYSYNACRVPWRLATDYLGSGDPRAMEAVDTINVWIRRDTGGDPALIRDGYDLRGARLSEDTSMAFVAPLAVAAMVTAGHQQWLNALWQYMVNTPMDASDYYGNTIKMLSMIVISDNWWAP